MGRKSFPWILALVMFAACRLEAIDVSSAPLASVSTFTWRTVPNAVIGNHEELTFVVKWGLLTAGYSTLSIKGLQTINGRPAYHLISEAKSGGVAGAFYHVEDHNEAWLDQQAIVSVRYEKRISEGKYQIEESTIIDQPKHHFRTQSFRFDKNLYEQKEGNVPSNVLDVLGSLYFVRLLPLEVGKSYVMDVLSGDKVYPLEVSVKKRQIIKVPAGRFDTFLVQPLLRAPGIFVAKGKKLEVWITADARRIPIRMRSEIFIGHVSAELLPPTQPGDKTVSLPHPVAAQDPEEP